MRNTAHGSGACPAGGAAPAPSLPPTGQERYLWRRLFAARETEIAANRYVVTGGSVAHDHDFLEVALIVGGEGVHRTIHGDRPVRSGDVVVVQAGAWHAYRDCRRLAVINCCLGADLLDRELRWLREDAALRYLLWGGPLATAHRGVLALRLDGASLRACRRHLGAILALERRVTPPARADQVGHLLLFLGLLARRMNPAQRAASAPLSRMHRAVLEGIRLLEADPARDWSLPELAARLAVAPSYLARLFRASAGLPPMAYLARRRAELAATLLLQTDRPVAAIGRAVGWPDPNHFARRFRAHFGISATAYRDRYATLAPGERDAIRGLDVATSISVPDGTTGAAGGDRQARG